MTEASLPETKSPTGEQMWSSGSGIDRDAPPKENYKLYRQQYRTFGPCRAAIDLRASEASRPGYMIEAESDEMEEALEEWFGECAVYAGESGEPFSPLLWQIFRDFDLDGEVPIELYWDDPEADDEDRELIGLKLVDPATLKFLTYEGTSMLIRPDDEPSEENGLPEDTPTNKRDELAAYEQYPEGHGFNEEPVYLSQNDLVRIPRNPGFDTRNPTMDGPMKADVGNIRGTSIVESVSDQIKRLRARLQDYNAAISGMAYPRMKVEFSDYSIGEGHNKKIYQWDDEAIRAYMGDLDREIQEKEYSPQNEWQEPGGKFGSPPGVEAELIEGSVPDIDDSIRTSLSLILSGLGTPKVFVGFGEELTRDIAEDQGGFFDRDIASSRRRVEHKLTMIAEIKSRDFIHSDEHPEITEEEEIKFRVRSEETDSVMRDEEFDAGKFNNLVSGIARLYDSGAVTEFTSQWLEHELNIDLDDYEGAGNIMAQDLSMNAEEFQEEVSRNRGGPSGNRGSGSWADDTATKTSGGSNYTNDRRRRERPGQAANEETEAALDEGAIKALNAAFGDEDAEDGPGREEVITVLEDAGTNQEGDTE